MIAIVKSSLKKVLGKSYLTYFELYTTLSEIENIMNSRPLTYLNEDQFLESLTPNHLIYGCSLHSRCYGSDNKDVDSGNELRLKVKHTEIILQHFTNRFTKEYLLALLERHSNQKRKEPNSGNVNLKNGDVVLIKDENKSRLLWRKGKVTKFLDSRDNKIRGVELLVYQEKTRKTCTINRPIQHLVPLEVENVDRAILDEEHDEPAGETRLRRQAAKNADVIRKLQDL